MKLLTGYVYTGFYKFIHEPIKDNERAYTWNRINKLRYAFNNHIINYVKVIRKDT